LEREQRKEAEEQQQKEREQELKQQVESLKTQILFKEQDYERLQQRCRTLEGRISQVRSKHVYKGKAKKKKTARNCVELVGERLLCLVVAE
jgi:hypothetical protein